MESTLPRITTRHTTPNISRFNELIGKITEESMFLQKTSEGFCIQIRRIANRMLFSIVSDIISREYCDLFPIFYLGSIQIGNSDNSNTLDNFKKIYKKAKNYIYEEIIPPAYLLEIEFLNQSLKEEHQCCVCYEITCTKTPCNHNLCYRCWNRIVNSDNKKCPMCRNKIKYRY